MSPKRMVTSRLRILCFGCYGKEPGSNPLKEPSPGPAEKFCGEQPGSCPVEEPGSGQLEQFSKEEPGSGTVEEPSSGPVEQRTLAQPVMEVSSSSPKKWQVFVSFRGKDIRDDFMTHLVAALKRKSIKAFVDDPDLRKGDEITQGLKEAIQGSRIAIVVFSENYASSPWCLNELLWILESKQTVVPIFYKIEPSVVRYQSNSFEHAFVEHSESNRSADEVQSWRDALTQVSYLSGYPWTKRERSEHDFVEKIAKDISTKLMLMIGSPTNFQNLVGIQSRIDQVTSLLHSESKDVFIVGIWGMGGIGKTTVAEAVFLQISDQFDSCHFIRDVRVNFGKFDGISLRNKVASLILGEECQVINPIIQDRLQSVKVLIVLDNVSPFLDLDFLRQLHFKDGSRIIITSTDKQVLQQVVDENKIYKVEGLIKGEDLELFRLYAFNARYPEDDFKDLSNELLEYAKGLPLALKAMGCALKRKRPEEWKGFLDKLKDTQGQAIHEILKISYDDLDYHQKNLFLDIACFFRGECKASVLEVSRDSAYHDIGVLMDKSLIFETEWMCVEMHNLLQVMGKKIVQESDEEPGKRSRLWKHEDVCCVLEDKTGTGAVQGMVLDMSKMKKIHITPTAFETMKNLKLINFRNDLYSDYSTSDRELWDVTEDALSWLSDKLNYLRWDRFPFKSLPLKFSAENLVQLILPFSNLEKLWDGVQNLVNLKRINLRGSKNLLMIPNLTRAKYLKIMDLSYCSRVVKIVSIGHLKDLKFLQLFGCISLCDLPNCAALTSLETLNLGGCSKITEFPMISESIEMLNLSGTGIQKVPETIGGFSRLEYLNLEHCKRLKKIPRSISQLESLEDKEIILCSFSNLGGSEELLRSVECLKIERSKYKVSIEQIGFVVNFNDRNSTEKECFRICMSHMKSLKEIQCYMELPGVLLDNLQDLQSLKSVSVDSCNLWKFPRCLTDMLSLKDLMLRKNNFTTIPESIQMLSALKKLDLSYSWRLQSLPKLPIGLDYLIVDCCPSLASISTPLTTSDSVRRITFIDCYNLDTSPLENEAKRIILHRAQGDEKRCAEGCINNPPLIISYPGSEIPKWFSEKSMGSDDITIELPSPCHYNKFLGIAFVAILEDFHDLDYAVKCRFKSECEVCHQFDVPFVMSREILKGFSGDDHVMIGYSCHWHCELLKFGKLHVKEASFSFSSTSTNKIKECGVCLL